MELQGCCVAEGVIELSSVNLKLFKVEDANRVHVIKGCSGKHFTTFTTSGVNIPNKINVRVVICIVQS